nr:MAG TPA: DnaB-like replicative helicase [Caudoviricetes sp.]
MTEEIRALPQDVMSEKAVLGSVFIAPDKLLTAAELVHPNDFYYPANQTIFKAMLELADKEQAIDPLTIRNLLDSRGEFEPVGGMAYLTELVTAVPTSANIEYYAKNVADKAIARSVINDLTDSISAVYNSDAGIDEIISKTEQSLINASSSRNKSSFKHIYDVIETAQVKIEERASMSSDVTGTPTGFHDFDKITTGLHEDNLIILAARPAMGKTALALNIARNVAVKSKKSVAVFSLEMGSESLVERMLAAEGNVMSYHIRTGKLSENEWQRLIYAQAQLAEAKIYIDDTPGIRVTEIRSRARKLAQETDGLGLIVIDYLQLITGNNPKNRQQEVSEISRQLKILAKELNVPVIALSQLSRNVEHRQDKRPVLSDLRESGSIEQDADIVAFLYREAYYDKSDNGPENNKVELILEKNRHGSLGTVQLFFHKEYTKFTNVEE